MEMLNTLTERLDRDVKALVWRRYKVLLSELDYKSKQKDKCLNKLRLFDWDYERLKYLLALNSFYQVVLLPIEAVSKSGTNGLGDDVEITYGKKMRHNADSASVFKTMVAEYAAVCADFGASKRLLTANRTGDILFNLERIFSNGD